jgi:hypothetical protein
MLNADLESVRRELEEEGWLVFALPEGMTDGWAFIRGVKSKVPLNPPLVSDDNWNALSDSLFSGIEDLAAERVALIWPGSTTMAELAPDDFAIAQEILEDNAALLADETKLMIILT